MKVLFVCVSGASTGVLRNRLKKYATMQQKEDVFLACGYMNYENYLSDIDAVCIAPQIMGLNTSLLEDLKQRGIPSLFLKESDMRLTDVSSVYQRIEVMSFKEKKEVMKPAGVREVLLDTLFFAAVLYLLCNLLLDLLEQLHMDTTFLLSDRKDSIAFLCAACIGIRYGNLLKRGNCLIYGLLDMAMTCFVIQKMYFASNELVCLILAYFTSILTDTSLDLLRKLLFKKDGLFSRIHSSIQVSLPITVLFFFVCLFSYLMQFLHH